MTERAITSSVMQVAAGVGVGAAIEWAVPKPLESSTLNMTLLALALQAALNGFALALTADYVRSGGGPTDPTYGIPFAMSLTYSQPKMRARIEKVSAAATTAAVQFARQTAA